MKKDDLIHTIDETLKLLLDVADEYLDEITAQFEDVGNPEELIKKPYEQWDANDFQTLSAIYGTAEPNILSNLIFRKTYERVKELESEEI